MIIVITKGATWKNTNVPEQGSEPRQFAHEWDPDEVQDRGHQAGNFIHYYQALGEFVAPFVLLGGPQPQDEAQAGQLKVELDGWKSIVETATGVEVQIR